MRDTTLRWAGAWPVGRPFVLLDTTQAITLDVIIEAVFGVSGSERVQRFRGEILALLASFSPLLMLKFLRHQLFGVGPWARFTRRYEVLRELVFALIAERRKDLEGRTDILSLLLAARDDEGQGLSDQEIMDQLVTLVLAGHETTAVMLAWALYCLDRNPDVRERLLAELAPLGDAPDPEALVRLPLLEAVCNETLRLYPPVHIIHRRLVRPLNLLGYELPPGTVVGAGAHGTHRLEGLYPEPQRFRPERFLERSHSPFEFLPWGGGARRCLGAAFALYEMKIVLGTLVPRFRLRVLDKGDVPLALRPGTVGPKGGIRVQLEP
jgi:cytochrome P450